MSTVVTLERQIRPIYEALDTGSNKSAIVSCNKLLKKYPNNLLVKACFDSLKALALVRSQKVEESLALCDEVLAVKPLDDATISAMMHVLKGLGRITDMVNMFDEAYKQQPLNEEYGAQTFFAHVRTANWKSAQQVSTRMHKQFQEDRYLYWSVMGAILQVRLIRIISHKLTIAHSQASDPTTTPSMKTLLYKLAHRLVTSSPTPSYLTADRFHMHISILKELELYDEANTLLESDIGKTICSTSLACDQTRREIWRGRGLFREEGEHAQQKISNGDHNWLEFLSVLDSTLVPVSTQRKGGIPEESKNECLVNVSKARAFLAEVAKKDGVKNRAAPLALLELEHRAHKSGLSDDNVVVGLMENYFTEFGDKACCFEDLICFLDSETTSPDRWKAFLAHHQPSFASVCDLQRLINVRKLERYMLLDSEITVETETARGLKYLEEYLEGLALGRDLPITELQPADDLILLAANALVMVWALNHSEEALYQAATVLEYGLTKSRMSFQMRIMLVRIYRIWVRAPSLALEHYRQMNIKQVQNDTLSHLILTRASTFSLAATGDLTYPSECLESSQIYLASSQETSLFVRSLRRSILKFRISSISRTDWRIPSRGTSLNWNTSALRLTHEPLNTDIIDMELIELKFMFDRAHHDNRDFVIIPNYQPHCKPTFNDQSLLFGTSTGYIFFSKGWLWCFLKIYIRAFQHASDLDDIVEEKLLVGDRPKKSSDPEVQLPLRERLAMRRAEETAELTSEEAQLLDWATALGDWLEPHHNHVRPPPAVVLAEASRQTELKTGFPLRGVDLHARNGDANGHPKKDDEAPPIKEAPGLLTVFFDAMLSRFRHLLESKCSLSELLHVTTIMQEAFILFTIETMRFKSPAVVKIHKLGNVTIVAYIVSVQAQATNSQYMLDDGSGRIEARHWTDSSMEDELEKNGIVEGAYVRVLGSLKTFGNKKYINTNFIRPIDSPAEIYFHLLEAMTVTMIWERGPPPRPGQNLQEGTPRQNGAGLGAAYSAQPTSSSSDQFSHLPKLHHSIITFIQAQPSNAEGIHVSAIARAVGGDAVTISDALDKLTDDGIVYSAADESHFLLC
ncbi:N-acetyltransferase B complex non catalytic subunit-domain-containing protein [Lanmaoa asiatica]|nr:N-acetyltransferase B complex non catalytic subunit-domain-containing protein [Lanmaoa asiatica]